MTNVHLEIKRWELVRLSVVGALWGLCFPCLRWWGRLCRRRCAAGGCARAVLVWGGVSRGYTLIISGAEARRWEGTEIPRAGRLGRLAFGRWSMRKMTNVHLEIKR